MCLNRGGFGSCSLLEVTLLPYGFTNGVLPMCNLCMEPTRPSSLCSACGFPDDMLLAGH